MYILGISCFYHDSSASLIKDGKVIAAAQEERFTRNKHDSSFPTNAIQFCLAEAGITINDIDHIGFYEKPILKFERILFQHLQHFPKSFGTFLSSMPSWMGKKMRVLRILRKETGYKGDVLFVQHHMAHAASSFLLSPFDKAAIVTIDGVGEWSTTTIGYGKGTEIHLQKQIRFPHSLGLFYSTLTAYLGFSVNNSEYKVMGLAPYGIMDRQKNPYYNSMQQLVDVKDDGSYRLDMKYFDYDWSDHMPSKVLCDLFAMPVRKKDDALTQQHKDIAAALQMVLEDVVIKILHHVYRMTKCENIVMSGGCALNSVCNGKILSQTPFKQIWIQPDAGDGGTSLGVAAYVYNSLLKKPRMGVLENAYLGPHYESSELKHFLDVHGIKYSEFSSEHEMIDIVSTLLVNDHVVGWFQGGMEWGPRALGARSILSNATNPGMQEILNLKVKHREKFRPFAPVVCDDDATRYFDCDQPVPRPTDYMLMVYPILEQWHKLIPAVTHIDGSGRLQTIRRHQNHLYYDLIKAFGVKSGIPILVNTSFNIRGEPIVCTPNDAYRCMMGTEIDYLVMGLFLIKRVDNPQDLWQSEADAKD
jgi:carbamoyltransferase